MSHLVVLQQFGIESDVGFGIGAANHDIEISVGQVKQGRQVAADPVVQLEPRLVSARHQFGVKSLGLSQPES